MEAYRELAAAEVAEIAPGAIPLEGVEEAKPGRRANLWRDAWRRLLRNNMAMLGRGIENLFIALIVTGWLTLTRLTRAQVLSLREKEYVKAARVAGGGGLRIVLRHMLPNALTPIVVAVTFGIPQIIFAEAALSFIGIGVNPPMPSRGQMVGEHQQYLRSSWWLAVFPTAAIALTMLSFTFLGDGIRDALDPRMNE